MREIDRERDRQRERERESERGLRCSRKTEDDIELLFFFVEKTQIVINEVTLEKSSSILDGPTTGEEIKNQEFKNMKGNVVLLLHIIMICGNAFVRSLVTRIGRPGKAIACNIFTSHNQLALSLLSSASASASPTVSWLSSSASASSSTQLHSLHASYHVDEDEDAEQRLGENWSQTTTQSQKDAIRPTVEDFARADDQTSKGGTRRFDDVLKSVGLEGKLHHVHQLSDQRALSAYDIFCNRELKLSAIRAIGFDMDYTLAQYQQPAFDKLAFDGAKEKLVKKLGYPEEVLEFEYDHQVRRRWEGNKAIELIPMLLFHATFDVMNSFKIYILSNFFPFRWVSAGPEV